ncbi:MAG: sigma-70 family RNA polymerase sigma factor [Clostridium sp.]|nr:sigma-70 family RNA polymerase sigma factor [Clostridium sp.]
MYLETMADVSEEEKEILELVLSLPNRYKNSIYLYYFEGFSTEEIARILGKAPSTIRTQLERGRKLLRTLIQEEKSHEV